MPSLKRLLFWMHFETEFRCKCIEFNSFMTEIVIDGLVVGRDSLALGRIAGMAGPCPKPTHIHRLWKRETRNLFMPQLKPINHSQNPVVVAFKCLGLARGYFRGMSSWGCSSNSVGVGFRGDHLGAVGWLDGCAVGGAGGGGGCGVKELTAKQIRLP